MRSLRHREVKESAQGLTVISELGFKPHQPFNHFQVFHAHPFNHSALLPFRTSMSMTPTFKSLRDCLKFIEIPGTICQGRGHPFCVSSGLSENCSCKTTIKNSFLTCKPGLPHQPPTCTVQDTTWGTSLSTRDDLVTLWERACHSCTSCLIRWEF